MGFSIGIFLLRELFKTRDWSHCRTLWMLFIVLLCMGVGMIRCVGDYPRVGALSLKSITGFDLF